MYQVNPAPCLFSPQMEHSLLSSQTENPDLTHPSFSHSQVTRRKTVIDHFKYSSSSQMKNDSLCVVTPVAQSNTCTASVEAIMVLSSGWNSPKRAVFYGSTLPKNTH